MVLLVKVYISKRVQNFKIQNIELFIHQIYLLSRNMCIYNLAANEFRIKEGVLILVH